MMLLQREDRKIVSICEKKTVAPHKTVEVLHGMVQQREMAFKAWPHYTPNQEKLVIVQRIKENLAQMDGNWKSTLLCCLRLERSMQIIAPRMTSKLYNSYMIKLEGIMDACRTALQYRQQ